MFGLNWLRRFVPKRMGGFVLRALAGGTPGSWSSDHRKESEQFHHWNGVAIHQLCLQALQADVMVYQDASPATKRKRRTKAYTTQDESREMPETHELVKLLKRPNHWESGGRFRYRCVQQLQLTGKCIIWNVPNVGGRLDASMRRTVMRLVIPTAIATPVQPTNDMPQGGWRIQPTWSHWAADAQGFVEMFGGVTYAFGKVIPYEQTQVIDWPHPLYVDDCASPTSRGARWIDGDTQVGIAQWSQLKNGADPSLAIDVSTSVDWNPELAERYAELIAQKYGGPDKVGKVMLLQGKAQVLSTTPRDMVYGEAFNQYRDAIMALHGAPKIDADTYASYHAKMKQFVELAVQPILTLFAEEDTERLAPEFGTGLTVEIEAKKVNDPELLNAEIATDVNAKAITKNEIRSLRGRPPAPDGDEWAGQPTPQSGVNLSGGINLNGGGLGFQMPTEQPTETAPSLQLPVGETETLPQGPRFQLNGKSNGHKAWNGYP